MSDQPISASRYEMLYARYLNSRSPQQLLQLAGNLGDKTIVDLCCGNGRLGKAALDFGVERVIFVDQNPSMTSSISMKLDCWKHWTVMTSTVLQALCSMKEESVDHFFCQQAVNYWFDEESVKRLARCLKPGGCFIFNTFFNKPSTVPQFKTYNIDGHHFAEAYYLIEPNIVTHVQMREGSHPHCAYFKWIPTTRFRQVLSGKFDFTIHDHQNTQVYVCTKRENA